MRKIGYDYLEMSDHIDTSHEACKVIESVGGRGTVESQPLRSTHCRLVVVDHFTHFSVRRAEDREGAEKAIQDTLTNSRSQRIFDVDRDKISMLGFIRE